MINQKKARGKRRIWLNIIAVLILIGVLVEGGLMLSVYIAGARNWPDRHTDAIIVLGARVMPDGELSTTLLHRVQKALELYEQGLGDTLIVCGAQGSDEPTTEAQAMADYLISHGVPEEHVLLEDQSKDTVQNIRNAMALMQEFGLKSATVVTSEYHLTRALWIARNQGLEAAGAPAKGPDTLPKQIQANFRETLSWINYFTGGLLGRVSGLSESNGE